MKKITPIIITVLVFAAVGAGVYYLVIAPLKTGEPGLAPENKTAENNAPAGPAEQVTEKSGASQADVAQIPSYQYSQTYTSPDYGFTFKYPKDFTAQEMPAETGLVILVQNIPKKIGAQIMISPFDGPDQDLTKAIIAAEIPDLKITGEQAVLIGPERKGLAFMSDNQAFGGQSREVWFVYNGNLYQISTYLELDPFLKGLFATWRFK